MAVLYDQKSTGGNGARTYEQLRQAAASPANFRPFDTVKLADFLQEELDPPEPMLGQWLPSKGLAMVYAKAGAGKTHFCLTVALSISAGRDCFGWTCPKPRKVLYIDGELPQEYLQDLARRLTNGLDLDPEQAELWFMTIDRQPDGKSPKLDRAEDQASIEAWVETNEIDLIIADNLSTLSASEYGENEAQSWDFLQSWALSQRSRGRTVLFVHHAGKGGDQRGTSKREDVLDSSIKLSRLEGEHDGAAFRIEYSKHRRGKAPPPLEVVFEPDGEAMIPTFETAQTDDDIIMDLWDSGMSADGISSDTSLSRRTVYRRLKTLSEEGRLSRPYKARG